MAASERKEIVVCWLRSIASLKIDPYEWQLMQKLNIYDSSIYVLIVRTIATTIWHNMI